MRSRIAAFVIATIAAGLLSACGSSNGGKTAISPTPAPDDVSLPLVGINAVAASALDGQVAYVLAANGVSRTGDGAQHWERVSSDILGLPSGSGARYGRALQVHPIDDRVVFVNDRQHRLWRTSDAGTSWTNIADDVDAFALDPSNPAVVFAFDRHGSPERLRQSDDVGVTWTDVYSGCMPPFLLTGNGCTNHSGVSALVVDAEGVNLLAGTDFGAYKSTDSGRTWTAANSGLSSGKRQPDYLWMPLIASGATGALFAGVESNEIVTSADGGSGWTAAAGGLPEIDVFFDSGSLTDIAASPDQEGVAAAAASGALWVTIDSGRNWRPMRSPEIVKPTSVSFSNSGVLYVANAERVARLEAP